MKKNLKRVYSPVYNIEIYRDEDVDGASIWNWCASKPGFSYLSSGHKSKARAMKDMEQRLNVWRITDR